MGCAFNGTSSELTRTATFDHNAAYTACGWVYLNSVATGSIQIIYMVRSNDFLDADYLYVTDGGDLKIKSDTAGSGSGDNVVDAVNADEWLFVAQVRSSATSITAYVGTTSATPITVDVSGRDPTTGEFHGSANNFGWVDGTMAHWNYYSRALSVDELVAQSMRSRPVSANGLVASSPMISGNRLADYSGNAETWTNTDTSDGDDPPVAWGNSRIIVPRGVVAAPSGGQPMSKRWAGVYQSPHRVRRPF